MDALSLIYLVCFGAGLLFALISAFFADLFGGHEAHVDLGGAHADVGVDGHDPTGFSPLSPTVLASFISAFGGLGLIFSQFDATRNPWISAILAIGGAFAIAAAVFWLMDQIFRRTQSSSESHVVDLIGQTATIITPIPPHGVGEIAYVQGGTRYTGPARVESGESIASGQPVVIIRLVGTQFFVVPRP